MLSEISLRARVLVEGRNGFTGEIEGPRSKQALKKRGELQKNASNPTATD